MKRKNYCIRLAEEERGLLRKIAIQLSRTEADSIRYLIKLVGKSLDETSIRFSVTEGMEKGTK